MGRSKVPHFNGPPCIQSVLHQQQPANLTNVICISRWTNTISETAYIGL